MIPRARCATIDRVVLAALSKRPDARFADAAAFARALRMAVSAAGSSEPRSSLLEQSTMPPSLAGSVGTSRARHRLARGSDCSHATALLRREIAGALRRGDVAAIADGYLALANALVERRQVTRATAELEEGIDIITASCDPRAGDTPPCVDRLVVALAALYDDAGDPGHARCLAARTDGSPTWMDVVGRADAMRTESTEGSARSKIKSPSEP